MVDEATLETLEEPNWEYALRSTTRKISGKSPVSQRLSLELLEACAMNCDKVFSEVASEKVLDDMVWLVKNGEADSENRSRAFQLIRAWGRSQDLAYLPVFQQTYLSLEGENVLNARGEEDSMAGQNSLESLMQRPVPVPPPGSYPIPNQEQACGDDDDGLDYNLGNLSIKDKKAQIEITRNSLDLLSSLLNTEGKQSHTEVSRHYEKCLVACANYPEFWIRYILDMKTRGSMDIVEMTLARATQVFVKNQPEIHLFAARLKEQNMDICGARHAYYLVHSEVSPGLLEAVIKHANMERRTGNTHGAFLLYEQVISVEKGKENSTLLPVLYAQYSRFSYLVTRDAEKARKIILEALDHVQPSKLLLEALIHFASIQPPPRQIDYLEPLVESFIEPNADTQNPASLSEREELSAIYIEFLGLLGDVKSIEKAEDKHAKLFLPHRSTSELKKRSADDFLSSDRTKIAKTYNGTPHAQPVTNAYPNAQAQWSGGYAAQPQTWPQVQAAPAQPQQWNPAYGQQAAYPHAAAYGAYPAQTYPSYEPAQAQPQQLNPTYGQEAYGGYSAYGAYGGDPAYGAYPAQTYLAQSYEPPAAAPAPVAEPAAAAAPQAYHKT